MNFTWRDIIDDISYCKMAASAEKCSYSEESDVNRDYFPLGHSSPYIPFQHTSHLTRFDAGCSCYVSDKRRSLYENKFIPSVIMRGGVTRNGKKWHMGNTIYLWSVPEGEVVSHPQKIQVIDYHADNKGNVRAKEINIGWFAAHRSQPIHHEYNRPFHIRINNYKRSVNHFSFETATCFWSPVLRGKRSEVLIFNINHKTGVATNQFISDDTDIIARFHNKINMNVNIYENQWFNNIDDEFHILTEIASLL